MNVYAAFNSVPYYSAPSPPLRSLHETLEGAIKALYPNNKTYQTSFTHRKSLPSNTDVWEGPDGFGMVKKMEVLP